MKNIIETLNQSRLLTLGALVLLSMSACSGSSSNGNSGSCDGVEYTLLDDEAEATIPEFFVGQYTMTYSESTNGAGIEDGDEVVFEILEDGTLHVGNDITLCNPVLYLSNDAEAIWKDEENDLAYALSDISRDVFNEINVSNNIHYDQGGFTYYGQFREDK